MNTLDSMVNILVSDEPRRSADRILTRLVQIHQARGGAILRPKEGQVEIWLSVGLNLGAVAELPVRWADHAQTLAIVLPGVLSIKRDAKREKLLQYGARVFDVDVQNAADGVDRTIAATRAFFESVGCPTRLSAYGLGAGTARRVAERLAGQGLTALGEHPDIDPPTVERILMEWG